MNHQNESYMPTVIIGFYSNPEHVSPLVDTIELLSKNFKVIVIMRDEGNFNCKYPDNVFLHIVGPRYEIGNELPGYKKISGRFLFILKIFSLIKKEKASALFLYDMQAFLAGYIANKLSNNLPIFYHQSVTSFLIESKKHRFIHYLAKHLEFYFCKKVQMLSFPDPYDAELFLKDANLNKKTIIIENCPKTILKLPRYAPQIQKLNNEGKNIVLHRGPLQGTDVSMVIRSIKYWPLNTVLVLVGFHQTDKIDVYKDIAKEENVSDKVIYVPYLDTREELLEFMAAADVGLVIYKITDLNHKYMGPTKFYDYIALGMPVLVPDEMSFISNMVKELKIGLTYDKPLPEVIGKNICELLEHPDRHQMSQKARQMHLSRLNYETQFAPLHEEIKKAVQKSAKY